MAYGYDLMFNVFRELYHQDLLDTTYYAHDNFLTTKRNVAVPAASRQRIEWLTNTGIRIADERIKANGNDKDAYFARGYLRGMHAAFITLADHSYVAAARQGYEARNNFEQCERFDPQYTDAKMAIGIQKFAVASLPRWVRMVVGVFGVGGNRGAGTGVAARVRGAWGGDGGGIAHRAVTVSAPRRALPGGAGGAAWAGGGVSARLLLA